ncbi:hypothetical protein [Salinibacillus xinjiangensis]|uniref:Uncharacterized protein n=1 Tax=Salinibacillus xinjiangensis TaxID=1229268 RepID=A0A6G1X693_9BACI|nr:hypothetical protein [Salinibacillus xinjiangensis]MRG86425.1 hypothetical protein [Salinibacillus xinjiangensis]
MKNPQEAVFASEEAEATPMESGVFCRNGMHALNIHQNDLSNTKESNYVTFYIYCKV